MRPLFRPRCLVASLAGGDVMRRTNNLIIRTNKRGMSEISKIVKEKTELDRKLESINFTLNDMGLDDCLSIPYHTEEQIQQVVIDNLVMFGVERELITLDCDLIDDVGINRFDLLQLIESVETFMKFSMLDDDALECRTVRQIANTLYTVLMYDKADQMHRGPYYCQSDFEQYVTFCLKVDELSYVDYLKHLFSMKK